MCIKEICYRKLIVSLPTSWWWCLASWSSVFLEFLPLHCNIQAPFWGGTKFEAVALWSKYNSTLPEESWQDCLQNWAILALILSEEIGSQGVVHSCRWHNVDPPCTAASVAVAHYCACRKLNRNRCAWITEFIQIEWPVLVVEVCAVAKYS